MPRGIQHHVTKHPNNHAINHNVARDFHKEMDTKTDHFTVLSVTRRKIPSSESGFYVGCRLAWLL